MARRAPNGAFAVTYLWHTACVAKTHFALAGDVLDLYSPAANPLFSWVAADSFAEPPTERYNAASCSLTDPYHGTEVLLVFGGTDEDGNSEGDLWEYTVYGESWRTHTAANGLNSGGESASGGGASARKRH